MLLENIDELINQAKEHGAHIKHALSAGLHGNPMNMPAGTHELANLHDFKDLPNYTPVHGTYLHHAYNGNEYIDIINQNSHPSQRNWDILNTKSVPLEVRDQLPSSRKYFDNTNNNSSDDDLEKASRDWRQSKESVDDMNKIIPGSSNAIKHNVKYSKHF